RDAPLRRRFGGGGELLEGTADNRVLGESFDAELIRRFERDAVGEGDALQNGGDLVTAIEPLRADDEREVDLRGGGGLAHATAAVSPTTSWGSSSSARV